MGPGVRIRASSSGESATNLAGAGSSFGTSALRSPCSPRSLGWFTEGFDTSDLQAARTLLDDLTEPRRLPRSEQARDLLYPVVQRFTEGFGTADLRHAQTRLGQPDRWASIARTIGSPRSVTHACRG